jgi:hypothetical protein
MCLNRKSTGKVIAMKNIQQLQDDGFSAARVGIFLGFAVWNLGFPPILISAFNPTDP